jgi:nitrite reductase/ring-hydroxylating ferredoxin subunit
MMNKLIGAVSAIWRYPVSSLAGEAFGYPNGICVESWQNANDQPHSAVRAMLSLPPDPTPPAKFWSSQYDLMIQIAGFPDANAQIVRHDGGSQPFWDFGRFAIGINRSRYVRQFAAKLAVSDIDAPTESVASFPKPSVERKGPAEGVHIGPVGAISEGEIRRIEIGSLGPVAIVHRNHRFLAVNDRCPHAEASLSEGFTEHGRIVCPVHFAEFDLQTGVPFNAPPGCACQACYTVECRNGELFWLF